MFCTACGTRNAGDARYCKQCGHTMGKGSAPTYSEEEFALPRSADDKVADLLVLAFQKHDAGDLEAAVRACSEALVLRPDSTSAHSLMGMLYEKQGDPARAISEYERVLQLNPGSIADREKLEMLRDGGGLTPRRITSSRRLTTPLFYETPGGAAIAAVAVFLVIVLCGSWWALDRAARTRVAQAG